MPDPCPMCGRDRDLVGISHLCVSAGDSVTLAEIKKEIKLVTKRFRKSGSVTKRKPGRRALGAKAMTQAERAKKYRAKKAKATASAKSP